MTDHQQIKQPTTISHSPAIIEYKATHSKDPKVFRSSLAFSKTLFSFLSLSFIYFAGKNLKFIEPIITFLSSFWEESHWVTVFYHLFMFLWLVALKNCLFYTLKAIMYVYKSKYPDFIFMPTLLKKFSGCFALFLTLASSEHRDSFENFTNAIKSNCSFVFFVLPVEHLPSIIQPPLIVDEPDINKKIYNVILPCITKIYIIFVFRDIVIFFLNYLVHIKYYEKRINENTEKINILRALNDAAKAGYTLDVEQTASLVYKTLSINGVQQIRTYELNKYFSESLSAKIFNFCNGEENDEITEDEIYSFYVSTLTEQKMLEKSIFSNNSSVESFNSLMDVFVFILISIILLGDFPIFNLKGIEFLKGPAYFCAAIFSVNYTFTESFRGFFDSLYFVFLVRPYEIGDMIIIQENVYEVHEINIFYSLFYDGCTYTVFPNKALSNQSIRNLRLNFTWQENFTYVFPYSDFENKNEIFLEKLKEMVKKKSSEYRKKPFFRSVTLMQNNKVEVVLTIEINTRAASFDKIRERKNALVFKLDALFKESDLIPFKE